MEMSIKIRTFVCFSVNFLIKKAQPWLRTKCLRKIVEISILKSDGVFQSFENDNTGNFTGL